MIVALSTVVRRHNQNGVVFDLVVVINRFIYGLNLVVLVLVRFLIIRFRIEPVCRIMPNVVHFVHMNKHDRHVFGIPVGNLRRNAVRDIRISSIIRIT